MLRPAAYACPSSQTLGPSMNGRIFFTGNPWPEGHVIDEFRWSAARRGANIWFDLHLVTANYYAERDIEEDEDTDYETDWMSPGVWGNYGRCTISSSKWHRGGFLACPASEYEARRIDGLRLAVDPSPIDLRESYETRAFHIYLLGHDSVADHELRFSRAQGSDLFNIDWRGRIALTYAGGYELEHDFRAAIAGVSLPMAEDGT